MQRITTPDHALKAAYLSASRQLKHWQRTCLLAGYLPPETEVEYQETKHQYPDLMMADHAATAVYEKRKRLISAMERALLTGNYQDVERERCAELCEALDPVAGAKFAAAIRARSDDGKSAQRPNEEAKDAPGKLGGLEALMASVLMAAVATKGPGRVDKRPVCGCGKQH